jgi:hypothetical protein
MLGERVVSEISIRGLHKMLSDQNLGVELVDYVDKILGALIAMSPIALGHAGMALWALIEPKNELTASARKLVAKLSSRNTTTFSQRIARLTAANCLITFTAYFDMLSEQLPEIMKAIGLQDTEKIRLAITAIANSADNPVSAAQWAQFEYESNANDLTQVAIAVNHPANDYAANMLVRLRIYEKLSESFTRFLHGLKFWDELNATQKQQLASFLQNKAPELACSAYNAEYLTLAIDFHEFYVWAVLDEFKNVKASQAQISASLKENRQLAIEAAQRIDIGMSALVKAIGADFEENRVSTIAKQVSETLAKRYGAVIDRAVIEDTYSEETDGEDALLFPPKAKSFVPQAFKMVRYFRKRSKLESERMWDSLSEQNDLGPFLIRYLQSPFSAETPLLILGHPGSGKSLLTEILAAQLAHPYFTTVRVELRDINTELEPQAQIEQQLQRDTGRKINWVDLSSGSANPPLVIFDGYDELLQASGKIHADYLERVRAFQERELLDGRPARVIITSRIALIDKAIIPAGTSVVRLLDFDRERQETWVKTWNSFNADYFANNNVAPFKVPSHPKVSSLAAQPLLLLMLAIYDSEYNQLGSEENIDQTVLYDNLLRRFIVRERSKGDDKLKFAELREDERNGIIDADMARLGVAAMSMFNRQAIHILESQLSRDIEYYNLEQDIPNTPRRSLTQADLLLGSFFFIHESKSRSSDDEASKAGESTAFEFLHNTFGEFLTADFILRRVLAEARAVCEINASEILRPSLGQRLAAMNEEWFSCLIHTPLDTRPVILQMLREWLGHRIASLNLTSDDIESAMHQIATVQLRAILDGETVVNVSPRGVDSPYRRLPILGHLAIYSLNLIVLAATLATDILMFTEDELGGSKNGCHAWDRLIAVWRSWMSSDNLLGTADQIRVKRDKEIISISYINHTRGDSQERTIANRGTYQDPIYRQYLTARSIGDHMVAGLSGLGIVQEHDFDGKVYDDIEESLSFHDLDDGHLLLPVRLRASDRISTSARRQFAKRIKGNLNIRLASDTGSDHLAPYMSESLDVIAQSPLTPRMLWEFSSGPTYLDSMLAIDSRHDAEMLVSLRNSFEPRWLPHLVSFKIRDPRTDRTVQWPTILRTTCAAPILRTWIRDSFPVTLDEIARGMVDQLRGQTVRAYDVETAALVAIIGWRSAKDRVCAIGLRTLTRQLKSRQWYIQDIPIETIGWLVDLFLADQSKWREFREEIASRMTLSLNDNEFLQDRDPGVSRDNVVILDYLINVCRLTGIDDRCRNLLGALVNRLGIHLETYPTRTGLKRLLSVIRMVRESANPEDDWMQLYMALCNANLPNSRLSYSKFEPRFLGPIRHKRWQHFSKIVRASDFTARDFNTRQLEDLAWADSVLHSRGIPSVD